MSTANVSCTNTTTCGAGDSLTDLLSQALAALALLANVLTIVVLARYCGKLSNHLRFVLNQCTLDLLLAAYYIVVHHAASLLSIVTNQLYFVTTWLVAANLTFLTVDHFVAISQPLNYANAMTHRKANLAVGASYAAVLAYCLVLFSILTVVWKVNGETEGFWVWYQLSPVYVDVFAGQYYFCMGLLAVCGVTLLAAYAYIIAIVYRTRAMVELSPEVRTRRQNAAVSFFVVITFIVSICFHFAFYEQPVVSWRRDNMVGVNTYPLMSVNSVLDPVIYALRLVKVKEGYRALWASIKHRFKR